MGGPLYLLHLNRVPLHVYVPGAAFGNAKRRVQAMFAHRGVQYSLWVTDPVGERKYLAGTDEVFSIGECFATISLGEPTRGYYYRLVAAIITSERART